MCDRHALHAPPTHWAVLRRVSWSLGFTGPAPDPAIDAHASQMRRDCELGVPAARALARACIAGLEVLDDAACTDASHLLPDAAAHTGRGHELTCSLIAVEAARRAGIDARLVMSPDHVALVVADSPNGVSAVLPEWGGVAWACVPAGAALDDSWGWCCPHEASRSLLQLLAPVLEPDQLPAAMTLVDALTPV